VRGDEAVSVPQLGTIPFLVMVQAFTLVAFHSTVIWSPFSMRRGVGASIGVHDAAPSSLTQIAAVGIRTVIAVFATAEPPGPTQLI